MIGRLRGTLISRKPPWLLVEVGGVGYEVQVPMSTAWELPDTGQEVVLVTHYVVRDDAAALYGFASEAERALFRDLLKVSGIGAKIALAILSGVPVDEFGRLVRAGDAKALTRVPGIGKKTAARLLVEMRDRVSAEDLSAAGTTKPSVPNNARAEALVALEQLGYKAAEAERLVASAAGENDNAETIIRKALRAAIGG